MWEEVLNLAIKNGLWAVLFMALFIFVIKDSTNREKKYQETISNLTEHLGVVKMIKEDVDDIKSIVYKGKKSTSKNSDDKEEIEK
ncbi:MAG: BhlA/UviB family holin-like peptide [Christensenellales bacterium]